MTDIFQRARKVLFQEIFPPQPYLKGENGTIINIKGANKDAKIYVGRSMALNVQSCVFLLVHTDYGMHEFRTLIKTILRVLLISFLSQEYTNCVLCRVKLGPQKKNKTIRTLPRFILTISRPVTMP